MKYRILVLGIVFLSSSLFFTDALAAKHEKTSSKSKPAVTKPVSGTSKTKTTPPSAERTKQKSPTLKTNTPKATPQKSSKTPPPAVPTKTSKQGSQSATTAVLTSSVEIKDFAFSPAQLTVKKGTVVTWTNQDGPKHNAFSSTKGGPQGKLLGTGEKYSFKADTVGTFDYICTPHPFMKGALTVTE